MGALSTLSDRVGPMKRRMSSLFTLALPVAAVGLALAWMFAPGTKSGGGVIYDTTPASKGPLRKIVSTSGPVRALVTVSVGSELSGQVDEVRVDFNTEVSPGDVLATIDDKTFVSRVAQAEADLAVAKAALLNQQAVLQKAHAVDELAVRNVERQTGLAAKGHSAQAALDAAVRDAAVAKADIAVAEAQIESARATIKQREAALDQARIDLERTEIRSRIEGTVISRMVDPGQTVAASLQAPELFKIAQDLSRIRIEAEVNEADVGMVAEGNSATFTVDAYPDRQFDGRVTQVRLSATEISSVVTYTVIIEAENEGRRLFPGMTANVIILSAERDGVLRVANDAFRFRPRPGTVPGVAAGGGPRGSGGGGDRSGRLVERLKADLSLTEEQEAQVRDVMQALGREMQAAAPQGGIAIGSRGPGGGGGAFRQRATARIEQVLAPTLSDEQRIAFQRWKDGRENARFATIWVLGRNGQPEQRAIRTGMADDQFTEVLGGDISEGDAVIVRARNARS